MSERTLGKRFSQVYSIRGKPEADSKKARFRLAKLLGRYCPGPIRGQYGFSKDFAALAQSLIEEELGTKFNTNSMGRRSWEVHLEEISVSDMLDTVTIASKAIKNHQQSEELRGAFLQEVQRIFNEENLAYDVDAVGGVHPLIDAAFSRSVESAIAGLKAPRYEATAACIERIDTCLLVDPRDYIGAIRAVFGACENTFKQMYGVPRLDAKTAGDRISADLQRHYAKHPTQLRVTSKMLEAFKDWVDAAHFYRHEQGQAATNQPEDEVAVLLISQGISFVRWLVALDQKS